ncbi:MAG TPA: hypothetical protein VGO52_12050 [Hyphomonadaceae bacterium]|jgi:hypothetical protein|nr:hypothetical protein [Hyphomonadaceae bacterium]
MSRIDWTYVQADAEVILADGLEALKAAAKVKPSQVREEFPCNYLVSLQGEARHVGEGECAQSRLRQQCREASSVFYKAYLKKPGPHVAIGEFDMALMRTDLGRKELEEFGALRLRPGKGKRMEAAVEHEDTGLWEVVQAQHARLLDEGVAAVMARRPVSWFDSQPSTGPGVYAVLHEDRLIYVGESPDLAERHEMHSDHTCFSALRRHIGVELLDYELQEIGGRRRSFTDDQDWKVTRFLSDCEAVFVPVGLGRYELEERLIATHAPLLNSKSFSKSDGQKNAEPAGQAPQV